MPTDPGTLLEAALTGDRRSLAKCISLVEDGRDGADQIVATAFRKADNRVVGVTGSPGAGKSTLVDGLVEHLRAMDHIVGVVAVDPSSPYSGGAILGDRIRMQRHVDDPGVYVRSMSSRGHLGGLASTTARVAVLIGAAGHDPVIVETVGVGQSEVEVVDLADTTVVVVSPGFGDGIQAVKAGILEVADILVVNKADLAGADELAKELRAVSGDEGSEGPKVILTCASDGTGIADVWAAIAAHQLSVDIDHRRGHAERLLIAAVRDRIATDVRSTAISADLIAAVAERTRDPWSIAAELVNR